jgi:hypothetical protein
MLLALMQADDFEARLAAVGEELSADERAIIEENLPWTHVWGGDPDIRERVFAAPEEYVIKSYTGFGGHEVFFGREPGWRRTFERAWDIGEYVVQRVVPHGRVVAPIVRGGGVRRESQNFMLGAYVIGGKCRAVEAKLSRLARIGMDIEDNEPRGYRTVVVATQT